MESLKGQFRFGVGTLVLLGFFAGVVAGYSIPRKQFEARCEADARAVIEDYINGRLEPEPADTCDTTVTVGVTCDGSATVNGEPWVPAMNNLPLNGGPLNDGPPTANYGKTKTQVTSAASFVSGIIGVYNQEQYPILISAPTQSISLSTGGINCCIEDISTSGWSGPDPQPAPPGNCELTFAVYIEVGGIAAPGYIIKHEFVYFCADTAKPWDIERKYSIATTGTERLWREEETSYSAGRHGKPVYSAEVAESDEWLNTDTQPWSWAVTFGDLSSSGTQTWYSGPGAWGPGLGPITGLQALFTHHKGTSGYKYGGITIDWAGVPVDLSGRKYVDGAMDFVGAGNAVNAVANNGFAGTISHGIGMVRPYLPDFTDFAVRDRNATILEDLLIDGGFVADPRYPWTANCPPA